MLAFPPDYTFVIQLVSFFVLLAVLNRLLFAPYAALLMQRAARTEGDTANAEATRAQAQELGERVDAELAQARATAVTEAEGIRRQAREEEAKIFADAKSEAGERLAELRRGIAGEREQAARTLEGEAKSLARQMVAAVLGGGSA